LRKWRYCLNLILFALALFLIAGVTAALYLSHRQAVALANPGRVSGDETPDDFDIQNWESISFLSSDGLKLDGWFIPPDVNAEGGVIIYTHGLGGDRTNLLPQAALLHQRRGYGALLFDLRNHGKSEGEITTLGYDEVKDVEGAFNYLLTRAEVNKDKIGIIGFSMGGAIVLRAAARIPQLKFVIAEAPYSSLEDTIYDGVSTSFVKEIPFPFTQTILWFGQRETNTDWYQVRPIDDLAQISPRPVMFIHGTADETIGVQNSQRLYEAAQEPKTLYLVPDAGHDELVSTNPAEFERQVLSFLDKWFD
jgi:uncharacterized protein